MVNRNDHEKTSEFNKTRFEFFFTTRMSALKLCHKIRVTIYRTKIPLTNDVRFCVFFAKHRKDATKTDQVLLLIVQNKK